MKLAEATNIEGEIDRIMAAGYNTEVRRNSDGTYFARIVEFPGCMTEGDTREEALAELDDAMRGWLEVKLEDGDPIPLPITDARFSGKFLVRVPKSVHRELSQRAEHEGVSLNQYVVSALSRCVGR
jgi:antitoxin HicB